MFTSLTPVNKKIILSIINTMKPYKPKKINLQERDLNRQPPDKYIQLLTAVYGQGSHPSWQSGKWQPRDHLQGMQLKNKVVQSFGCNAFFSLMLPFFSLSFLCHICLWSYSYQNIDFSFSSFPTQHQDQDPMAEEERGVEKSFSEKGSWGGEGEGTPRLDSSSMFMYSDVTMGDCCCMYTSRPYTHYSLF